jgi:hypothetical protein
LPLQITLVLSVIALARVFRFGHEKNREAQVAEAALAVERKIIRHPYDSPLMIPIPVQSILNVEPVTPEEVSQAEEFLLTHFREAALNSESVSFAVPNKIGYLSPTVIGFEGRLRAQNKFGTQVECLFFAKIIIPKSLVGTYSVGRVRSHRGISPPSFADRANNSIEWERKGSPEIEHEIMEVLIDNPVDAFRIPGSWQPLKASQNGLGSNQSLDGPASAVGMYSLDR